MEERLCDPLQRGEDGHGDDQRVKDLQEALLKLPAIVGEGERVEKVCLCLERVLGEGSEEWWRVAVGLENVVKDQVYSRCLSQAENCSSVMTDKGRGEADSTYKCDLL